MAHQGPQLLFFLLQALEDRGIVELLLTSDNKDGLSKGVVDGGVYRGCRDHMAALSPLSPGCQAPWDITDLKPHLEVGGPSLHQQSWAPCDRQLAGQ